MPDITSLIASIRKEVGGAEPGTMWGDVLELCAWAERVDSPDACALMDCDREDIASYVRAALPIGDAMVPLCGEHTDALTRQLLGVNDKENTSA